MAAAALTSKDASTKADPPDGGWGWFVVLGTMIIAFLLPTVVNCFGILFSRPLIEFQSSTTTVAWIFNLVLFLRCFWTAFAGPLCDEFGWRKVAFAGVAITSVSLVLSAFATSSTFLLFSFSFLTGIGTALSMTACFLTIPHYFRRRRGLANALMVSSASFGQMALPALARFLQDEYGYFGATVILGALVLNGCIGAALFHPVEWHGKAAGPEAPAENTERLTAAKEEECLSSQAEETLKSQEEKLLAFKVADRRITARRKRLTSECSLSSMVFQDKETIALSSVDISDTYNLDEHQEAHKRQDLSKKSLFRQFFVIEVSIKVAKSTFSGLKILKQTRSIILSFGKALLLNGYFNMLMLVPFALQAEGHSLEGAAYSISVVGLSNAIARLVVSSISDYEKMNKITCHVAGILILSASSFGFTRVKEMSLKLVAMCFVGIGFGSSVSLHNLIMIEVMGLENYAATLGSSSLVVGFVTVIFGPIIGFVRDATGNYDVSISCLSAILLVAASLWLLMPLARKFDERSRADKDQEEVES